MHAKEFLGWDIGGAHLKTARVDGGGAVLEAAQFATPLWLGLQSLSDRLAALRDRAGNRAGWNAVTMTGEMADIFPTRREGVRALLDLFARYFDPGSTLVYAPTQGLIPAGRARELDIEVASANWHATASYVAAELKRGILIDAGSTTTDIIPFDAGRPCNRGATDIQRLRSGELVYAGVVRTPVMAIVRRVPYAGYWQNVAAEHFATSADVYRLTGDLDEADDMMTPADQRGKTVEDSARRLARMLGTDFDAGGGIEPWREVAQFIAGRQLLGIEESFECVASALGAGDPPRVIGAGCGRFLARRLAAHRRLAYLDFDELLPARAAGSRPNASVATAVAVAQLARLGCTA